MATGDKSNEVSRSIWWLDGEPPDPGEAAQLLGVCARTFRRYLDRYDDEGLEGLLDKRLSQISHRRAPVPGEFVINS